MQTFDTSLTSEDADRMAQIALELDSGVGSYTASDLPRISWLAVPGDAATEPTCSKCGATFTSSTSCPKCGAPRVQLFTTSAPQRFTINVEESGTGSRITVRVPGDEEDTNLDISYLRTLEELLEDCETVADAETLLAERIGGFVKESDHIDQQVRETTGSGPSDSPQEDHLLEIMKVLFVAGILLSAVILLYIVAVSM